MSERVELNGESIELGEIIGTGATGVVHEARMRDGRRVAVKLVHAALCNSSEAVSRYAREVTALSKLTHPASVQLYGHGEMRDGRVFIVMELLEGEPLNLLVRREAPLAAARIVPLIIEVCGAVAEAHRIGLVHRDIKPENLFVVRRHGQAEHIKLMDFGFVRFSANELASEHTALTVAGSVLGTPGFMSPEQARGQEADERSDVYALGVTLYECLCSKLPFEGSGLQLMAAQSMKAPIPLDKRVKGLTFPEPLVNAIMRAIDSNVATRTESVQAFADELHEAMSSVAPQSKIITDRPPAEVVRSTANTVARTRSPVLLALVAFALVALGAALVFALRR